MIIFRTGLYCPRCDNTAEVIRRTKPNPHIICGDCIENDGEVWEMKIIDVEEQLVKELS